MGQAKIDYWDELRVLECGKCGIAFAVPPEWLKARKGDHSTFYCPNGHPRYFPGESDAEKLQRRLDFEKQRREAAERDADYQRNRARAQKAAKTRLEKRIAAGVCPCCKRSFENLANHMRDKHPDYSELDFGGKS